MTIEHGEVTSPQHPSGNRGVHGIEGFNAVLDEAARAAIVQTAADRGRIVRQTAGSIPGWYIANGAGGWQLIGTSGGLGILAVAYAATLNLDVSLYKDFEIGPLTGNLAITLTNGVDGSEGLINVKQDGGGVRTVSIVAAGRTVIKSTSIASLAAALGAGAQTVYWYRLYTIDGVGYLQLSIDFLA
jgi:hypothetical protein